MKKSLLMALTAASLGTPALLMPAAAQTPSASAPTASAPNTSAPTASAPATATPDNSAAQTAPESTTTTSTTTTQAHPPAVTKRGQQVQQGVEQRIKDLHAKLNIKPDQQKAWDDFAETMRQNADHADRVFQKQVPAGDQDALSAMRAYADITQAHAEDVQRLLPKFEALYNGLSPEQKKAADETFAKYQKRMMEHHAGK